MPDVELEHLIKMINQISENIACSESDASRVSAIAAHVEKFWARSMKKKILAYADADGSMLNPLSKKAVQKLTA